MSANYSHVQSQADFTYDKAVIGKISNYLPMTIGSCIENSQKLHMTHPTCIEIGNFLYMIHNEIKM
jgi:hypothetical protein